MFLKVAAYYILMFYVYCFLGWCFESLYVSLCRRYPENRGLVSGPFVIIYGVCAMVLISIKDYISSSMILAYFIGAIVITVIEYFTGEAMEMIFGRKFWDYSNQPFNFKGHICLSSSLAWGVMSILLVRYIHPSVTSFLSMIDTTGIIITAFTATVLFLTDYIQSFRREFLRLESALIHVYR